MRKSRARAFTMVELLLVMVIIGILGGALMLVMGSGSERVKAGRIVSDMATLKKAAMIFYYDTGDMPVSPEQIEPYVDKSALTGPSDTPYGISEGNSITVTLEGVEQGVREQLARLSQGSALFADPEFSEYYSGGAAAYTPFSSLAGTGSPDYVPLAGDFQHTLGSGWIFGDGSIIADSAGRVKFGDDNWTDFELSATVALTEGNRGYGLYYRASDDSGTYPVGYAFQYDPGLGDKLVMRKFNGSGESIIKDAEGHELKISMSSVFGEGFDLREPHDIQIRVEGDHHQVFVDDQKVFDFIDDTYDSGHAGARLWLSPTGATFENIEVTEM